ncbi:MAG: hypothetical protein HGA45_29820, partial [Chloroflexales bacterium]|nr:hypothetical protein [Chloroflexales bacterium]
EVVVGTSHSGAVAYDLPGSASARVLWATGRGSYQRTGVAPAAPSALSLGSPQPSKVTPPVASISFTVEVTGGEGLVTLAAGAPRGPAPLPVVAITSERLSGPGQATVTMTAPAVLASGAVYAVDITADNGVTTRTLTLRAFVDGSSLYLPLTVR